MKRAKSVSESPGERLRKAREKLGLSVEDVAKRTKMSPLMVTALEEDQASERLSPIYVRSFIRMYAHLVGLDERSLLEDVPISQPSSSDNSTGATKPPPLPSPTFQWKWPRLRLTRQQCAIVGGLVVSLILVGWIVSALRTGAFARRSSNASTQKPFSNHAVKATTIRHQPPKAVPRSVPSQQESSMPAVSIPAQEPLKLQVKALQPTWLRVTVDGKVLFQSVLEKGRAEQWLAQNQLVLWVGNAGGVELTLNGKALGAVGRRGEIIRELVVTHAGVQRKR